MLQPPFLCLSGCLLLFVLHITVIMARIIDLARSTDYAARQNNVVILLYTSRGVSLYSITARKNDDEVVD